MLETYPIVKHLPGQMHYSVWDGRGDGQQTLAFEENYDMSWDPYSLAVEKRRIMLVIAKRTKGYNKIDHTQMRYFRIYRISSDQVSLTHDLEMTR